MAIIRRVYHLEDYLKPVHFNNLGLLLLTMTLLWFYFTFAEHLTTYYGHEPTHMAVFYEKLVGRYAPFFWTMVLFNFAIPLALLCNRRTQTVTGTVAVREGRERALIETEERIKTYLPGAAGEAVEG